MGNSVKLKDLGRIECETRHQGGEWMILYNDPDNPNTGRNLAQYSSQFGAGRNFKKPLDALSGLGADLRKRGYTGSIVNMKPQVIQKKFGVKQ